MNVQDPLALRRAALMRQQRLIQEQLEQLEAVPALDEYPDGTVIKTRVNVTGRELTYVFLKLIAEVSGRTIAHATVVNEVRWYHTGFPVRIGDKRHDGRSYITTEELTRWLTEAGRYILEWTLMLPIGTEPKTVIFKSRNRVEPGNYVLQRAYTLGDGVYVMGQPA